MDFNSIVEKAAANAAERNAKTMTDLNAMSEEVKAQKMLSTSLFSKALKAEDGQHEREMNAEIAEATKRIEREIKAKYARQYGEKSWNGSKSDAYRELLHGLIGENSTT